MTTSLFYATMWNFEKQAYATYFACEVLIVHWIEKLLANKNPSNSAKIPQRGSSVLDCSFYVLQTELTFFLNLYKSWKFQKYISVLVNELQQLEISKYTAVRGCERLLEQFAVDRAYVRISLWSQCGNWVPPSHNFTNLQKTHRFFTIWAYYFCDSFSSLNFFTQEAKLWHAYSPKNIFRLDSHVWKR